ncbi:MAG: hypothetical protein ACODAA_03320 [Gemmatimonadota bacterium]
MMDEASAGARTKSGESLRFAAVLAAALGAFAACGEPVAVVGDTPGIMRVVAGMPGVQGDAVAERATQSELADPVGLAIAPDGRLYVVEEANERVVSVSSAGALAVVQDGPCISLDCMDAPNDVALDPQGRLVATDRQSRQVWLMDPDDGSVEIIAGTGENAPSPDGTPAGAASLEDPRGVAVDMDGTVYFSERPGHRVRFIDASGELQTLAGTGEDGFSGDGGPASEARLSTPGGLGIAAGVLYVADSGNDRIRAIDLSSGTIETVAGSGVRGFSGDGGPATAAALNFPEDVAPTPDGRRIFIADTRNHRVRHVPFETGEIETFAGIGDPTFTGDLLDAGAVGLDSPAGVSAGPFGFLFVSDPGNDVVWRVTLGF